MSPTVRQGLFTEPFLNATLRKDYACEHDRDRGRNSRRPTSNPAGMADRGLRGCREGAHDHLGRALSSSRGDGGDGLQMAYRPLTDHTACLDRVPEIVKAKPELANVEPFKTVLSGNREAIAKLPKDELFQILEETLTGMSVDEFQSDVTKWLRHARDPRWQRPYTELTYLPMIELLKYLRANNYKTYIVTGGGQDFVRVYGEQVYGIPPEQVVGTMVATSFSYDPNGRPLLTKVPKLLLNDDNAGKPEGIHLMIGRRPRSAFGNSSGDRQMLEFTKAGDGARLAMLVLHDDEKREYAYGTANGLPDTKVGTFPQTLYDEAQKQGWTVISMKNDWKQIFRFEK